jgi:hypothetical protein
MGVCHLCWLQVLPCVCWKDSLVSPHNNHERTEAHQGIEFQLERQPCLLHRPSLFHNLENHEGDGRTPCASGHTRKEDRSTVRFLFDSQSDHQIELHPFLLTSSALSVEFTEIIKPAGKSVVECPFQQSVDRKFQT